MAESHKTDLTQKAVLGLVEEITLVAHDGSTHTFLAKIDTGANTSSIDIELASKLQLGPITKTKSVVSSHGRSLRPIVPIDLTLAGRKVSGDFTLYNRAHMTFKFLIGRNILREGFLIDPSQNKFPGMSQKDVVEFESEKNDSTLKSEGKENT